MARVDVGMDAMTQVKYVSGPGAKLRKHLADRCLNAHRIGVEYAGIEVTL